MIAITQTQTLVIKGTLPENMISPTEIGKFKLEHDDNISRAIFDASKEYMLEISSPDSDKKKHVTKFKGIGNEGADCEWFMMRAEKSLEIRCRQSKVIMGGEEKDKNKKRELVYDGDKIVGTKPRHLGVDDLRSIDQSGVRTLLYLLSKHDDLKKILADNGITYEESMKYIRPDKKETYNSSIDTLCVSTEIVSGSDDNLFDDIDDDSGI